jgi:acyl-CoA thioesterase YciA
MSKEQGPPNQEPAIRMTAMPADTNPSGDIFGGWLMSLMDLASANVAFERAEGRVATVAVDKIEFHYPVAVGDVVSCYAEVNWVGRTSLSTRCEVWIRGRKGGLARKVTQGEFTFVALDDDGHPRPVDPG